ncbi:MAG: hypothetical protein HYZ57_17715 [Acidobacteria bacterium]|nr:hypothetical protein [Acidobacteriota bacterium]MBI3281668.1 hypothetical protein [Acidobacteriota bacterium]
MTYRVVFRKRFNAQGEPADNPASFVDVSDGVVLDSRVAEESEPPAQHVQEVLDEDDDFESLGTEVWEYEITDGREQEFIEALENSRMVLDYEEIDEATTPHGTDRP